MFEIDEMGKKEKKCHIMMVSYKINTLKWNPSIFWSLYFRGIYKILFEVTLQFTEFFRKLNNKQQIKSKMLKKLHKKFNNIVIYINIQRDLTNYSWKRICLEILLIFYCKYYTIKMFIKTKKQNLNNIYLNQPKVIIC